MPRLRTRSASPRASSFPYRLRIPAPSGVRSQAEQNLAVHLGEASQLPTTEQVICGVDGALVCTDDVPGPDRVVVAIDPFIPAGPPARVTEQNRCTVVDTGQDLAECLVDDEVDDELTGGDGYRRRGKNVGGRKVWQTQSSRGAFYAYDVTENRA
jgi:hypothetical protein